ncbi:MAG TPA: glycosyltransferase family 2 protein [Alphaproteobacteria bacterium]|nr:glycosyltransferase family 2 protein [Alphaproteobacteria bacterium]
MGEPASGVPAGSRLAILLATRNGARYIDEQLRSLAELDWPAIDVHVSDDGSTDATLDHLASWRERWTRGAFAVSQGPRAGFSENFRSLLCDDAIEADYVAFCDQDDVWLPDKMRVAAGTIGHLRGPALFCSTTTLIDQDGRVVGHSPMFRRPPGFRNALVQSLAGGNTMVLNRAALRLLREGARRTGFVSHDWFAYQLVTGAGGTVCYSLRPLVRYRQHGGNVVGSNTGWGARLERLRLVWRGRFADWNDQNVRALDRCRDLLTPSAQAALDGFKAARAGAPHRRLYGIYTTRLYRQTISGQFSLYVAAALAKL